MHYTLDWQNIFLYLLVYTKTIVNIQLIRLQGILVYIQLGFHLNWFHLTKFTWSFVVGRWWCSLMHKNLNVHHLRCTNTLLYKHFNVQISFVQNIECTKNKFLIPGMNAIAAYPVEPTKSVGLCLVSWPTKHIHNWFWVVQFFTSFWIGYKMVKNEKKWEHFVFSNF